MKTPTASSLQRRWLVGLIPSYPVSAAAGELRQHFYRIWGASAPLPALLPLGESPHPPPPPVPGERPPLRTALIPGSLTEKGGWLFWQIDHNGELARWSRWLDLETKPLLFPPLEGIPLAPLNTKHRKELPPPPLPCSWRALHLAAWELEFSPVLPWWQGVFWKRIWIRRLKRAPAGDRLILKNKSANLDPVSTTAATPQKETESVPQTGERRAEKR